MSQHLTPSELDSWFNEHASPREALAMRCLIIAGLAPADIGSNAIPELNAEQRQALDTLLSMNTLSQRTNEKDSVWFARVTEAFNTFANLLPDSCTTN